MAKSKFKQTNQPTLSLKGKLTHTLGACCNTLQGRSLVGTIFALSFTMLQRTGIYLPEESLYMHLVPQEVTLDRLALEVRGACVPVHMEL